VREKSNERKRTGEGARLGSRGRQGRAGRSGPGRAGLGHTAGQNPMARTTTDRKSNAKWNPKRDKATHAIKHEIRQRIMIRHDATLMST
jgi:hypothetical protein